MEQQPLTYVVTLEKSTANNLLLRCKFGADSGNGPKVVDAKAQVDAMIEAGAITGDLLLVNGAASLPVAVTIAHGVAHLVGAVAVYDPKEGPGGSYIVSVAHGGKYAVGQTLPASEV